MGGSKAASRTSSKRLQATTCTPCRTSAGTSACSRGVVQRRGQQGGRLVWQRAAGAHGKQRSVASSKLGTGATSQAAMRHKNQVQHKTAYLHIWHVACRNENARHARRLYGRRRKGVHKRYTTPQPCLADYLAATTTLNGTSSFLELLAPPGQSAVTALPLVRQKCMRHASYSSLQCCTAHCCPQRQPRAAAAQEHLKLTLTCAASSFSLMPPTGSTRPRSVSSPAWW